ncbi:MAG TPA: 2-oxo-4-hydroxy-4-carboxy-5-ureidoimidazoline decarboxylase [Actinomycetes bacterium]|jgi:OHCU decarboxylase|nr:2-oxo-4-hydroxy-4-carboxy-5-ureidoimidazoline decarboxylase [Actinomycetes bacterium]
MARTEARAAGRRPIHPVDEILPPAKLAVYGFQHVLAFYAGAVIVPILLAGAIHLTPEQLAYLINADLFTCGIASIIQSVGFWRIGVRMPLLQGVTFAAVSPMISIGLAEGGGTPGLRAIYGSVIVAGIFAFLVAPFFARLIRLFPPIVTGTVITIIGIVLLSVAALDAGGGGASQFTDPPTFGRLRNLALAGFTLLVILAIYRMFTGFLATVAVLIGLMVGTLAGWIFDFTDFSRVAGADVVGVTTPFHFGAPTFPVAAVISLVIVMLITMVETTGDVFACGEIVGKPIDKEDVARALRADGLATTLGGILNSFPYTCFAENVGLVRLTKVKSRFVVATAGLFMIVIGLIPKVGAIVAAIPPPVLGGAGFALFGTVAVIGIQTLRRVDFHDERNVIILAVSLGFAMTPTVYPAIVNFFPESVRTIISSGITLGSISAIVLNLVFNVWGGHSNLVTKVLPVPRQDEVMSIDQVNQMDREQFVDTFGGLFQGPPWIAEQAYRARPFEDVYDLRRAFHDALFEAPAERQLELIRQYPDLAGAATREGRLSSRSAMDQAYAGLNQLDSDEYTSFDDLTRAYREKFGFPLVVAVRENTKETILKSGNARLQNSPAAEQATALVEIAKIANLRLLDIVEEPVDRPVA